MNNLAYVVILSAALDIVGPNVPKGAVLLANILPSLFVKLTMPYIIHAIPYNIRILSCTLLSLVAMQTIAWSGSIAMSMTGIIIASASSGLGEMSWLMLTSLYHPLSVSAFASGTGAAGVLGAVSFLAMTSWFGWSMRASLMILSSLPLSMAVAYFVILGPPLSAISAQADEEVNTHNNENNYQETATDENYKLPTEMNLCEKLLLARSLLVPYMLPLFFVYWAEYTINQGVAPTLLFPLEKTPFRQLRDHYVTYQALYQVGVFISRSSVSIAPIQRLWVPSLLQVMLLALLIAQSLNPWLPSIWILFVLILGEGLLGGATYVNCYYQITKNVPSVYREFSLGSVGAADSLGIASAGLISLWLEGALCQWQQAHGSELCTNA
ncbi:batten's disease protein Cln3, partial [Syncephalis fuscata]